jgi:hypothetical protein
MLIPPPGGNSVHPAIASTTEHKCQEFQSQLKQVSTDLAHLPKAEDKLQSDKSYGATRAQIRKDKQTVQSDTKALATAADRLFEDLEPPVSYPKEMQDRDQASIEERVRRVCGLSAGC